MYSIVQLALSVTQLSQLCFRDCTDVSYPLFTTEEEACIRECVRRYFDGYQTIAFETYRTPVSQR